MKKAAFIFHHSSYNTLITVTNLISKNAFTRITALCECERSNLSLKMRHKNQTEERRGGAGEGESNVCSYRAPASQACTFHRSLQKSNARFFSTMLLRGPCALGPATGDARRAAPPDPGARRPFPAPRPHPPLPGLTVWEALLALSGGNARGDGGPVPAPARETPDPVTGEDGSGRPLSPALPAESRGVSAADSGSPSGSEPVGAAAAPALGRYRRPSCFGQKPLKANHRRGAHTHRSG